MIPKNCNVDQVPYKITFTYISMGIHTTSSNIIAGNRSIFNRCYSSLCAIHEQTFPQVFVPFKDIILLTYQQIVLHFCIHQIRVVFELYIFNI